MARAFLTKNPRTVIARTVFWRLKSNRSFLLLSVLKLHEYSNHFLQATSTQATQHSLELSCTYAYAHQRGETVGAFLCSVALVVLRSLHSLYDMAQTRLEVS